MLNFSYMKRNNASKPMWASTTNEKMKQDAQKQDAILIQVMSVLFMAQLEDESQH